MKQQQRHSRQGATGKQQVRNVSVVLLPLSVAYALQQPALARWFAQCRAARHAPHSVPFTRLLQVLELPLPASSLAGIRLWGHVGERPGDWVAAADPVWMQAGLDRIFLHAPPPGDIEHHSLRGLYADLEQQLFAGARESLQAVGECGYLRGGDGMVTAEVPACAIAGEQPNDWLPSGHTADSYHALTGELQMAMHEHPFNVEREAAGRQPLNALWLWGGGRVEVAEPRALPALFGNEPLLRGYGFLSQARVNGWPGRLTDCLKSAQGPFIACVPDAAALPALDELHALWRARKISNLTVLFTDARCDFSRGLFSRWRRKGPARLFAGQGR